MNTKHLSEREALRFWGKVAIPNKPDGCLIWKAGLRGGGYGAFQLRGHLQYAHRVAYEFLVGPIPEGLVIDHLCRNRACVNPSHMEPVVIGENTRRGQAPSVARNRQISKTHCQHGHEYAGTNLIILKTGKRRCRECARRSSRERMRRIRSGVAKPDSL